MKKHVFSVIGCQHAHITMFIQEMLELGHKCAGIYDPEPAVLAESVAEKFQIPLAAGISELLAPEIEIVGCAAINNEKINIVEICEQNGKHIMLDKPAVTNREGYRRLEAVQGRGRIQIGMLLTERFSPPIYTLKNHIDSGTLGRIVGIGMRKPHRLTPEKRPKWFFSKEQSGGIVVDLFIHDFDLLRWLTGTEIAASQGFMAKNILPEYPNFYDAAGLQVLMEGGVLAQLYADWHTQPQSWTWGDGRIFISGTKGSAELRLAGDPFVSEEALYLRVTHDKPSVRVELDTLPFSITEDFLNRIYGKNSILTAEDILAATRATVEADEQVKIIDSSTIVQI